MDGSWWWRCTSREAPSGFILHPRRSSSALSPQPSCAPAWASSNDLLFTFRPRGGFRGEGGGWGDQAKPGTKDTS